MKKQLSALALGTASAAILSGSLAAQAGSVGTAATPEFNGIIAKECTLTLGGTGGAATLTEDGNILKSPTDAVTVSATSNLIDESTGSAAVSFALPADLTRSGGFGTAVPANTKAIYVGGEKKTSTFTIDLAANGSLEATDLGVEFTLSTYPRWPAGTYTTSVTVTCTDNGSI